MRVSVQIAWVRVFPINLWKANTNRHGPHPGPLPPRLQVTTHFRAGEGVACVAFE